MNRKILVFVDYFLPGNKAGGPIHAINNLTKTLGGQFDFYVVTRDRDLGDKVPYMGIDCNQFIKKDNYHICYLSKKKQNYSNIKKLLLSEFFDVLYLNSFFSSKFSWLPLLAAKRVKVFKRIIIAPRGELYAEALSSKKFKKKCYIFFNKIIGTFKHVFWQASSSDEQTTILKIFPKAKVYVAPEMMISEDSSFEHSSKEAGVLRLIYLARINPHKNLLGTLNVLSQIKGQVFFDIYGAIEHDHYFSQCQALIQKLPPHIHVQYKGFIKHHKVIGTLASYDLYILQSLSENFGYSILEALSAGTPVFIHKNTPWGDVAGYGAGTVIGTDEMPLCLDKLEHWVAMNEEEHQRYRQNAKSYALKRMDSKKIYAANVKLFAS